MHLNIGCHCDQKVEFRFSGEIFDRECGTGTWFGQISHQYFFSGIVWIFFFFIKDRRDNLTLKEGGLDFEVNIYLQAQPAMAHDLSLVEPAQPPAYLWSVTFKRCLFIKRLSAIRFRFLWFCFADHTFDGRSPRGSDTNIVAKCQFFTQIISVQLNLHQEKMRKLREVFDI